MKANVMMNAVDRDVVFPILSVVSFNSHEYMFFRLL